MRTLLLVLLVAPWAGCTLIQEPEPKMLVGPTDGYTPTATFLKLHVVRDDGTTALLDFERRDWYTAEIARRVDVKEIQFVSAEAMPRDILNEYLARVVSAPEDLQALRYDEMDATPEQRASMDAEHEELLRRFLENAQELPTSAGQDPAGLVPEDALP